MHKKSFLLALISLLFVLNANVAKAQSNYTDEQVYRMVQSELKGGATRQQVVTKLIENGVQIDQIRRIQRKYKNENKNNLLGTKEVIGSKKRTRTNNGDKKSSTQPNQIRSFPDRSGYDRSDLDYEKRSTYNKYNEAMDFMFPDSMSIYPRYEDEEEPEKIKVFGRDIFNKKKLTFETSLNIATPANYVLGPGDDVFVDIYGASQKQIESTISPEGTIDIENYGPVNVGGMTVAQANARLGATLGSRFSGSKIRLTVGQTKTIQIQVMGAVKTPGSYTVSAFATVFHALYMAGGTNDIGTLRNIKVFRRGHQVSTVDIYDYILNGKMTGNIKLADNDIIIVGPYESLVNIAGKVKRPMYYEMKKNESIETLLNYAGGFTGDAYKKNVRLTRKNGERYSMFTVDEFERPNFKVMDGDSVSVDSTLAKFENMVVIKGAVMRPGMYEIGADVHTIRELLNKAQGLAPKALGNHAVMHRKMEDESLKTISLDLTAIIDRKAADVPLQNEDVIYVMSTEENQEEKTFTIFGEVNYPGIYKFAANTTVEDLIIQAGGLKDAASVNKVDISRRIRDNKTTSITQKLANTFSFPLKDGLLISSDNDSTFILQPFDEVYIRKSPGYVVQKHITIEGEVAFPGEYTLENNNERLSDVIKAAGGLNKNAYPKGAQLQRTLTYEEMQKQQNILRLATSGDSIDMKKLELGNITSVGINLDKALEYSKDDKWNIVLEEGDRIIVPQYRNTVSINGEVMFPTTLAYKDGANLSFYIDHSGGFSSNARKGNVFIVNMNGTVNKVHSYKDIQPGSTIVVPSKNKKNKMSLGEMVSLGTMTASLASIIAILLK